MKNALMAILFCLMSIAGAMAQEKPKDTSKEQQPTASQPATPPPAASQPTIASVLDRQLSNLEKDFVPAAEAMPEDKFNFAPSNGEFKGVRTFAQQVRHVAATNLVVSAGLLQEKPQVDPSLDNGPEDIKSKDDIVKLLKESFALAHKAIATINDKNVTEMVPNPWSPERKVSRLGLATLMTAHSFDHYGQMVEYLRMNGIIPPASRK